VEEEYIQKPKIQETAYKKTGEKIGSRSDGVLE
jgi:hypothetical protein